MLRLCFSWHLKETPRFPIDAQLTCGVHFTYVTPFHFATFTYGKGGHSNHYALLVADLIVFYQRGCRRDRKVCNTGLPILLLRLLIGVKLLFWWRRT